MADKIVQVATDDFEGRVFWINEDVGQAHYGSAGTGSMRLRLPAPLDAQTFVVTASEWKAAMRSRFPRARRRLSVPEHFVSKVAISDDTDWSSSASSSSVEMTRSGAMIRATSAPTAPVPPVFVYPEGDALEALAAFCEHTLNDTEEALVEYASLLADLRVGGGDMLKDRGLWARTCAKYSHILGPAGNQRAHVVMIMILCVLTPVLFWSPPPPTKKKKETDKKPPAYITTGAAEILPPILAAFCRTEEMLTEAQCYAAASAGQALAVVRAAQRWQPRALGAPRVREVNGSFVLDLETRLLAGFGADPGRAAISAETLCRTLLPKLHGRALRRELPLRVRRLVAQWGNFASERALVMEMDDATRRVWQLARSVRDDIKAAVTLPRPEQFFLATGHRRRSVQPERIVAFEEKRARDFKEGKWTKPEDRTETTERLAALNMDMEDLFKAAPPCMARVLATARTNRHLKNSDCYPLATWLAVVSPEASAEDLTAQLFGDSEHDQWTPSEEKIVATIRVALRNSYAPFSCSRIAGETRTDGVLACPFGKCAADALAQPAQAREKGWIKPVLYACGQRYVSDKKMDVPQPPLLYSPVDYLLFYNKG